MIKDIFKRQEEVPEEKEPPFITIVVRRDHIVSIVILDDVYILKTSMGDVVTIPFYANKHLISVGDFFEDEFVSFRGRDRIGKDTECLDT